MERIDPQRGSRRAPIQRCSLDTPAATTRPDSQGRMEWVSSIACNPSAAAAHAMGSVGCTPIGTRQRESRWSCSSDSIEGLCMPDARLDWSLWRKSQSALPALILPALQRVRPNPRHRHGEDRCHRCRDKTCPRRTRRPAPRTTTCCRGRILKAASTSTPRGCSTRGVPYSASHRPSQGATGSQHRSPESARDRYRCPRISPVIGW